MKIDPSVEREIRRVATDLYGSQQIGPNRSQWDRHRQPDAPSSSQIMSTLGLGCNGKMPQWRTTLSLVGLSHPTRGEAYIANKRHDQSDDVDVLLEVDAELRRMGRELYGDTPYGPNQSQYNRLRSPDLPTARRVMYLIGIDSKNGRRDDWARVLARVDLRHPTRKLAFDASLSLGDAEEIPTQSAPVFAHHARHAAEEYSDGLPVIPCTEMARYAGRPMRRIWCPISHRYRRIPTAQTYMAR